MHFMNLISGMGVCMREIESVKTDEPDVPIIHVIVICHLAVHRERIHGSLEANKGISLKEHVIIVDILLFR